MSKSAKVSDKIFDILELIAFSKKPISFSEIVKISELSKSTVHRNLCDLSERKYIRKNNSGKYIIGEKCFDIVSHYIDNLEFKTIASTYLSTMYTILNLPVFAAQFEKKKLKLVTVVSDSTISYDSKYNMPICSTAIGKVLLSGVSNALLDDILQNNEIKRFTQNTELIKTEFLENLKTIRTNGYSIDDEEYQKGKRCIAVPVYDYSGAIVASIGIMGDLTQVNEDTIPAILDEMMYVARQISNEMGYVDYG